MAGPSSHEDSADSFYTSFVDLLVGVLFLFLLIMMSYAINYKEKEHDFDKKADALINIDWARRDMLRAIAERMQKRGYTLVVDMENGILRFPEDLLFDSAQWKLNEKGEQAIGALASVFAEVLPCGVKKRHYPNPMCQGMFRNTLLESVFVEGHTDKQPYSGGGMTNWELSSFRAIAVYRALVANQPMLETRLLNRNQSPVLGVSAYAERRPVDPLSLDPNRRIDIRFNLHAPSFKDVVEVY